MTEWGDRGKGLLRLSRCCRLDVALSAQRAARALAVWLAVVGVAGCGGGDQQQSHLRGASVAVPCIDEGPSEGAVYANAQVAIARAPNQPGGAPLESHRRGGKLPWFAKTGLFVHGNRPIVVRVQSELSDAVTITGWGQRPGGTATAVSVKAGSGCPEDWTAYPGGLLFHGRHCVRLLVEGPGDAGGSLRVGLRRRCFTRTKD